VLVRLIDMIQSAGFASGLNVANHRVEIMADHSMQTLFKARLMRRGLMFCGSFFALAVLYVASIGPLAFLESQGVLTENAWKHLRGTAYYPIYHSWWNGPKWLDVSLGAYVGCFETSDRKAETFGAENSHWIHRFTVRTRVYAKREREQLEWDIAHPVEARVRKEAEMREEQTGGFRCYAFDDITKAEFAEAESNWWQSFGRLE
jgi:hypothetical protein